MPSLNREGDSYIINGRKWWTSGAMDPRCKVLIVMVSSGISGQGLSNYSSILLIMGLE
jgi:acyl-CoA dehydrogenase